MISKIKRIYHTYRFSLGITGLIFGFVFGAAGLVVVNGEALEPDDMRVVTLYVDGREYDVPTRARTVGELLKKADISLSDADNVEPSEDSIIEVNYFRVRVTRARPYTVLDGNQKFTALTAHTSARLIAEAAGLTVKPADIVDFAPIENVPNTEIGRVVEVTRSKQVSISLYGSLQSINTNKNTVGELLEELSIVPGIDDQVSMTKDQIITDKMLISINRNGIETKTEEIVIDQPVEYVQDDSLTMGSSVVRDNGKPGKKITIFEISTINGLEISRREISSVIVEQAIPKIIARGRAAGQIGVEREQIMMLAGIPQDEYAAVNYIIGQESGWCATKWQGQYGRCPDYYEELHNINGADSNGRIYGYGLCQSTPAGKMATISTDWQTNAVAQLKWCYNYMLGYGSATAAADFKQCLGQCYSPRTRTTVTKQTTWF